MKRHTRFAIVTALLTLGVIFLGPELLLRMYHGKLLDVESLHRGNLTRTPRAEYDPHLGWVPAKGHHFRPPQERSYLNEFGLRSNGPLSAPPNPEDSRNVILAVGDSFTFGDRVSDHQTWPAQLERLTGRQVLNGGVFGYGVDQAYLRAQSLLETYDTDLVLLALIDDDVNRAEFSYFSGWKPYFEWVDGDLLLRNTPVPRFGSPSQFAALHSILGYSYFSRFLLRRVAPTWWYGATKKVHSDGERVTIELAKRLGKMATRRGAVLVVITLPNDDDDWVGVLASGTSRPRLPAVVKRIQQHGIRVLDLAPRLASLHASVNGDVFVIGHYSESANAWVAEQIAGFVANVERHESASPAH